MSDQKSSDQQPEQSGPITPSANQFGMQDPRAQYPAPPFPRQPQEAPGTVGAMQPRRPRARWGPCSPARITVRRVTWASAASGAAGR
ncbi:hypothetical protein GCM10008019_13890 [Deinococcus soli (ex Cha et al. 2016)]|nr:hypothetical protein GCM10008019_13890 [Deinococcus soli (ex Cha et al. 2016)]